LVSRFYFSRLVQSNSSSAFFLPSTKKRKRNNNIKKCTTLFVMNRILDKWIRWSEHQQEDGSTEHSDSEKQYVHWGLLVDGPESKVWTHISKRKTNLSPIVHFAFYEEREVQSILLNKEFIRNLPSGSEIGIGKLCRHSAICVEENKDLKHDCESWCRNLLNLIDQIYPPNDERNSESVSLYLLKVLSDHPYSLGVQRSITSIVF
jgi:hypothetical protein